jgi:hypothetical protein
MAELHVAQTAPSSTPSRRWDADAELTARLSGLVPARRRSPKVHHLRACAHALAVCTRNRIMTRAPPRHLAAAAARRGGRSATPRARATERIRCGRRGARRAPRPELLDVAVDTHLGALTCAELLSHQRDASSCAATLLVLDWLDEASATTSRTWCSA